MKNAILYVRVSTDEQARLGYSLGHQEVILSKYCDLKQINIVAIYKEDFSAKNFERPGYQKLLKYCKANKRTIDYVLISKWDRFSRNQRDALQEIKRLSDLGIEVNAAEQWIDFAIPHNKMMLSIYLTIPEIDNDVRGINTKMGLRRSWKLGRWTGTAPAGYKNERDHLNKPIIVKGVNAELVREAFEQFSTGLYDKQELRKIMWKKGLKLSKSQFPNMLENVLYCGKVLVPEHKDEDEQIVPGIHEAIVSEELFNKVQRVLKNKSKTKKQYETLNEETPLRGLLICPQCGGRLTSSASKGRKQYYNYYHCRGKCKERIPAETGHKAVIRYFDSIPVKPEIQALYLKCMESVFNAFESKHNERVNKLKANLTVAESKLAALEEKFVTDQIEKDSYHHMRPKFKAEMEAIKSDLQELDGQHEENLNKYLRGGVSMIQDAGGYYEIAPLEEKQKMVGSFFKQNLMIKDGECRTTQENRLILSLRGFERDFKQNGRSKNRPFLSCRLEATSIEPVSAKFDQIFGF